jgi:molybdate transport system ATP-binding protein
MQRAALAKAIARRPKILLLDEPLAALDDDMRFKLQEYIVKAHHYYRLTTLLVSHNLPEILRLADTALILDEGKFISRGKPEDIFRGRMISGKFTVTGEIIEIKKNDIVYIVSVLSMNNIIKLVATEDEINKLEVGQKVLVQPKVFNPIIQVLQ